MANNKRKFRDQEREFSSMNSYDNNRGPKDQKYDDPPNSRLFIVCGKSITEENFREAFGKYGEIEEVWVVKDRTSGEPKGVTYIKFSKTSEAALAMEEMNGKCIGTNPRPLKVLIAHSREQGSRREMNEEERLVRLFVVVSKSCTEQELREHFQEFGDIDYVSIVKDRNTKESKGFGYVKYHRMYHAALAFEGCDRSYKPVFADPKPSKQYDRDNNFHDNVSPPVGPHSSGNYDVMGYMDLGPPNPEACCRLNVYVSSSLNQDQIWRLFDIVPGLDFCDLRKKAGQGRSLAIVVYNNPQSAGYAREKLHGFEYPPGERLIVKFDSQHSHHDPLPMNQVGGVPGMMGNLHGNGLHGVNNRMPSMPPNPVNVPNRPANLQTDLATLAETIAQATSLIQAAGLSQASNNTVPIQSNCQVSETYDPSYCSVRLPPPQPLAPVDSTVAERLFIVCHPSPPQLYILKDVFGRFGNLIDIYMLGGKSCGYAKYHAKESAERAMMALHGQEICGLRLKVMPADPQDKGDMGRKRLKMDLE